MTDVAVCGLVLLWRKAVEIVEGNLSGLVGFAVSDLRVLIRGVRPEIGVYSSFRPPPSNPSVVDQHQEP